MVDFHCINVGGTFKLSYDLSAKKSSLQVCVELNLKCWQCFPREISRDENRKVLKRRGIGEYKQVTFALSAIMLKVIREDEDYQKRRIHCYQLMYFITMNSLVLFILFSIKMHSHFSV